MKNNKWDLTRSHIDLEMYKSSINKKYIYLYEDGKFTLIEDISKYKVECRYMEDGKSGVEHEISNGIIYNDRGKNTHFVYEAPHKYPGDMCFLDSLIKACFVNFPDIKEIPLYVGSFIVKGYSDEGEYGCARDEVTIKKPYPEDTYFMFKMWQQWFNSVDDFYIKDEMRGERDDWRNKVVFSFDWDDLCEKFKDNTFVYTTENQRDDYNLIYFDEVKYYHGFEGVDINNFLLLKSISVPNFKTLEVKYQYDNFPNFVLFYIDFINQDNELEFSITKIGFKNLDGIVTNFMELR